MFDNNPSTDNGSADELIRIAAYFKWLDAGRPDGRDLDFWCQAEQDHAVLRQAMAKPSTDGAPPHRDMVVRPKALLSPARRDRAAKAAVAPSRQKA